MAPKDWDPVQRFRLSQRTWDEFGEACAADGKTRSVVLRDYVRRYVAAWKGRRGHDARSADDSTDS